MHDLITILNYYKGNWTAVQGLKKQKQRVLETRSKINLHLISQNSSHPSKIEIKGGRGEAGGGYHHYQQRSKCSRRLL